MDLGLEALTSASAIDRDVHRPEFYRLALPADRERLRGMLKHVPGIRVHDELHSQLRELVRALNPSTKYTAEELDRAALAHLGDTPATEYGVWVYYPWSDRLVHLLDEAEFTLVRTDRNRNKITREEQARLQQLRIGVVGLSVGQSICLTLALERGFGELRIADHDTLELSNLNRIRSGVHSMGHLKTINVAREIAELDPFLTVTLFNEGIQRTNIDRFFSEGGPLDIVVDECDSIDVKIFLRQKARELRVPVIMDTSDRGMLDIERFDLEPERPILHGLIDHLDPNDAAKAKTNEEKLPFVLPILNVDTLSKRMKASMLEIESSVTTWPQLASSVVLGGALGAEYCRRIALGQSRVSGRWFTDMDVITGELKDPAPANPVLSARPASLSSEAMAKTAESTGLGTPALALTEAEVLALVEAGSQAPSAGNNQPWKFFSDQGRLFLFHDRSRSYSGLDGGQLIPGIGLGACIENIRLTAAAHGAELDSLLHPLGEDSALIAVFSKAGTLEVRKADPLSAAIGLRCSNRRKPKDQPFADSTKEELMRAVTDVSGCSAHWVTGPERLSEVAEHVCTAERIRMLNRIGHQELFGHEIRWTPGSAVGTGDGLDLATLELKPSEQAAMRVAADPEAIGLLREWKAGNGFRKLSGDAIRASAAVCLVSIPDSTARSVLEGGRAAERMWLAATAAGIAVHPISAPIFLAHHIRYGGGAGFDRFETDDIIQAFAGIRHVFATKDREPLFMARLAFADQPTARSIRLPLSSIFHHRHSVTA